MYVLLYNCAISIDSYTPVNKIYCFAIFSLLIIAVILLLKCLDLILYLFIQLFSLLKHYLELYITDTALKVSRSLYFFTTSIFHDVENYFPRLWGPEASLMLFFVFGVSHHLTIFIAIHVTKD